MTDEQGYNGWTNYQTWVMNLWLTNDEGLYRGALDLVETAVEDWEAPSLLVGHYEQNPADVAKAQVRAAGDALQEWAADLVPELEGFVADMFNSAWGLVDWVEIAQGFASELAEVQQ